MIKPTPITRREVLLGALSTVAGCLILRGQENPSSQAPTFAVDVEVVNVFVTARDKKGNIVKDLLKEEFALSEDDRIQNIQYFTREIDLPLTIGLLVDMTPSESNMLEAEQKASLAFLNRMLRPEKDSAFLIQYSNEIELLQDLTSSREKLEAALNRLQSHGFGNRNGRRGSRQPAGSGYETALADAVYLASDEIMKLQQGRKALFILGDGDHLGDREKEAIEAAQEADTMIYSIRIYDKNFGGNGGGLGSIIGIPGMGGPGGGRGGGGGGPGRGPGGGSPGPGGGMNPSNGKKNLQELSSRTGGAYFEVGKKETLDQIYGKIEEELRSQYSLGYTPEANAAKGYRRIKISVQRKGVVVRGREGYYPKAVFSF
jgi:VWFA-related protein